MNKTWIVVAGSTDARILATENRSQSPTEVARFMHPSNRMKEQQLETDAPGRTRGDGYGTNDMGEPHAHERELQLFAQDIAATLEDGRNKKKFEDLILVAPPAFLGTLRQQLNEQLRGMVSQSLDKNLVDHDDETVRKQLFDQ